MDRIQLSGKWIKASILGTIWAALEIVLGSFLHNLHIPFGGNILTAIALVLLISVSYKWQEDGIIWRTGVIAALLKSMSPSAVIFGPMIGIFMEAMLLELSIRTLGRNALGYLVGSALAMAWILVQVLGNFVIYYGFNIVKLYDGLVGFAQRQLNQHFDSMWIPILILMVIYAIFGLVAGLVGMRSGRRLASVAYKRKIFLPNKSKFEFGDRTVLSFNYSIPWMFINLIFILGSLISLRYIPFLNWAILVIVIAIIWAIRYKNALRQLAKPKFWTAFIVITMLTSILFTKIQTIDGNDMMDGIRIGIEMNLRAIIMVMGFSVLGTELYNPKIRNYLRGSRFKQLSLALELSLDSLPSIIAYIPSFKQIIKDPIILLQFVLFKSDQKMNELKPAREQEPQIYILTGELDEGKTTYVRELIDILKSKSIDIGGFVSTKVYENDNLIGYDVLSLNDNHKEPFLRLSMHDNNEKRIGKYVIKNKGLEFGFKSLNDSINDKAEVIVLDEIGRLELSNEGWADGISNVITNSKAKIILVVREDFVEAVINKWHFTNAQVVFIDEFNIEDLSSVFLEAN